MRYAAIKENDIVDGEGVCVSFWVQGCPHRCKGCHNPETWSFNGGFEIDDNKLLKKIIKLINKNGVQRNLSILGGEPLCIQNKNFIAKLIIKTKQLFPNIKIYLWTGYKIEDLKNMMDNTINIILKNIDVLIDGPFIEEQKDITLKLRGSKNQRVLDKNKIF
jgi:anaerobic ribonucleoside-triphosphate reductase activating protein